MNNRRAFLKEVFLWTGLFIAMVVFPLFVALAGHNEEYRGFWIEFGVGLGFIGIAMMGLQFVLTARFKNIAASIGTDALLNFHRQAGYVAYCFVLGHVVVLIAANTEFLSFFDPRVNAPRAMALVTVILLLTLLVALTIWRKELRITYERWRLSHAAFAFLILFIGLAHILMVGFYISELWQQLIWIFLVGFAMAMLVHIRIIKPYQMSKRPYRVTNTWKVSNNVWTLEVEPVGHEGIKFEPGQFAWLTIGPTPFSTQQHPFSFSSSTENTDRYRFSIKELGDFTSTIKTVERGTRVFLEGAYGAFTLNPSAAGVFFVVGGIGITPVISMLRTLRDRGDQRPLTLIYGNPDPESIAFKEELDQLEKELNLDIVHVLENPPEGWTGFEGFITEEILTAHMPENTGQTDYLVCGPEPMMDMAETALRGWGIPVYKIKSERFNIV